MRVLPATRSPTVPSSSLFPTGPRSSIERHRERSFFFAAWISATAALQRGTDWGACRRALEKRCRRDPGAECPAAEDARNYSGSNRLVRRVEERVVFAAI